MDERRSLRAESIICLLLALSALAVYWQAIGFDFVNLDDNVYITENPNVQAGLTRESIRWAFTATYRSTWQPLIWISYMLDYEIGGLEPWIYHLTNLALHIANTLLLFLVLSRMTGHAWRSGFVAALFALHPLHVESVAWVAERKDVLSTLFWMLAMWAYIGYTSRPSAARYTPVVLLMALGLMSKPMLVTLPAMLLLLDFWPLGRFGALADKLSSRWRAAWTLLWEKVPLFALAAASSVVTFWVQRKGGAVGTLDAYPVGVRVANALVACASYVRKTIWPDDLAAYYPHPGGGLPVWQVVLSALFLLVATGLAARSARRRPYILAGWVWYIVTLLPVIGLVQIGGHAMADRFSYIPLIGVFVMLAWAVPDLATQAWPRRSAMLAVLACAVILALMSFTFVQIGHWRDSIALLEHAVRVTDGNAVAHNNLGVALVEVGRVDEGIAHYQETLRIRPGYVEARCNLANALIREDSLDEAIALCRATLRRAPKEPDAYNSLGVALAKKGRLDDAFACFVRALSLDPNKKSARANLERAKRERGGGR